MLGWYDRYRWFYFLVLAGFYLAAFTGQWQPEPDSALYLSIGRNLAQGEGYHYHGYPHALAYPGMPYLIAGTFVLFGIDVLWPAHVLMLLMAGATLALSYRLVRLHLDRPTAVFVTCLLGMTFTLFRYAFELRNDLPFTLGVMAFLAGWEACLKPDPKTGHLRIRPADVALMIAGLALAVVMRPHMWVLVVAIVGAGVIRLMQTRRMRRVLLGMIAGVGGLVALLLWLDPRQGQGFRYTYEAAGLSALAELLTPQGISRLGRQVVVLLEETVAEAALGHQLGPVLTSIVSIALLAAAVVLIRRRWLWGLLIIGTVLLMLVLPVPPAPRYLLPIVPLMALGWFLAIMRIIQPMRQPWRNVVFIALLSVWVVPNFLKILKEIAEQRYPPMAASYQRETSLRAFSSQLRHAVEPDAWVLASEKTARVLSYWSDRRVAARYELPPQGEIDSALYILEPIDPQEALVLKERRLRVGPVVVERAGDNGQPTWTLRRLIPEIETEAP